MSMRIIILMKKIYIDLFNNVRATSEKSPIDQKERSRSTLKPRSNNFRSLSSLGRGNNCSFSNYNNYNFTKMTSQKIFRAESKNRGDK